MLRARLPLVVGLSLLSLPALAQTGNYDGAPQQGVEVQYRFTNPGQSQQILTAQPASSTAVRGDSSMVVLPRGIQSDVRAGVEVDYAGLRPSVDAEGAAMDLTDGVMELLGARGFSQTHAEDMPMTVGASSIYRGVTPDARDTLPHISPYQRAAEDADDPNQLTWVGFQRFDDKARVFIQTGRPSQYRTTLSPDGLTITIELRDTRVGMSNLRRPLDTSFYGTPVHSVFTQRGEDGATEVVIALSRAASHEVTGAGEYVYLDVTE